MSNVREKLQTVLFIWWEADTKFVAKAIWFADGNNWLTLISSHWGKDQKVPQ